MSKKAPPKKLVAEFKRDVSDRAAKIDPGGEEHWGSLTLGWAIAKGMKPEDARRFANYIRYQTDLA